MKRAFLTLIRLCSNSLSSFLSQAIYSTDRSCRFTPSCSQYTWEATVRYGIIKGIWKGAKRLLRCHPFSIGGVDFLK